MSYFKLIKILIFALPEIVRLIKAVDARYDEEALTAKIKEDMRAISDAFEKKDGGALTRIFDS